MTAATPPVAGVPAGDAVPQAEEFVSSASACAACVAAPLAERIAAQRAAQAGKILLSLPDAQSAEDMVGIERGLEGMEGVRAARVNLTRKRVSVAVEAGITPEALIARLES